MVFGRERERKKERERERERERGREREREEEEKKKKKRVRERRGNRACSICTNRKDLQTSYFTQKSSKPVIIIAS